jgi:ubiquinone/menaquinone biosynthesis C-methylase UbiE
MIPKRGYRYLRAGWELMGSVLTRETDRKKRKAELGYWELQSAKDADLSADHYEFFYTDHFDLGAEDYADVRVLDIGCGPRGSLNWATMTDQRVGLDPLVEKYSERGILDRSEMEYVDSGAEEIPFPDGHFDVVTSFNSLDHVDDIDDTIAEIKRVTAPGGLFLLITDVNHEPTVTEPVSFGPEIVEAFEPEFRLLRDDCREKSEGNVYSSAKFAEPYDFSDDTDRYGVLSAKFEKQA